MQRKRKTFDYRWLAGGLIALAVVGILGFKATQARPLEPLPTPQTPAATLAMPGPKAPTATGQTETSTSESASISQDDEDPLPTDPIGQLEWAERHQKPMMILFHSTTCIPCKAMDKLLQQVRGDYEPGIVFVDIITNDRANIGLVQQAGIRAIPTSFFVTSAGEGKRFVGAMQEEALRAELDALLEGGEGNGS